MIKSIEIENFKNTSGEYQFDSNGLTGIIGNNKAGKTTILEAIEFAITGSVGESNKNVDVFNGFCQKGQLSMRVKLVLDDATIVRTLSKEKSKDDFKYTGDVAYNGLFGNEKGKQAEALISLMKLSPLVFGFKDFLNMTGTNRKKLVLQHCNVGDIDKQTFAAYIYEKLEELKLDQEVVQTVYVPIINNIMNQKDDLLDGALKTLESEFKLLNEKTKLENHSAQKFAELKASNDSNMSKVSMLQEEIKKYNEIIETSLESITKYSMALQSKQRDESQLIDLLLQLENVKSEKGIFVYSQNDLDIFEKAYEVYKTDLGIYAESVKAFESTQKTLADEYISIEKDIRTATVNQDMYSSNYKTVQSQLFDFNNNQVCPITKSVCNGSIELVSSSIFEQCNHMRLMRDTEQEKLISLHEQFESCKLSIKANQDAKAQLMVDFNKKFGMNYDEYGNILANKIQLASKDVYNAANFETQRTEKIKFIQSRIDEINAKVYNELDMDVEITKSIAETAKETKQKYQDELDQIKEKLMLYKAQVAAHEEYEIASAKLTAVKALQKIVGPHGFQGEFILSALDGVTKVIEDVIVKLIPGVTFFYNMDGNEFDFGINGVSFESLSGYEQIAVSLAMIIGLSVNRNYKLIVIDEINNIHSSNIANFINTLSDLNGFQFIVAGTLDNSKYFENCIEL